MERLIIIGRLLDIIYTNRSRIGKYISLMCIRKRVLLFNTSPTFWEAFELLC
jgi:hypothetical protein